MSKIESRKAQKKAKKVELILEKRRENRKLKKIQAKSNKKKEPEDPENPRISKKEAKIQTLARLEKAKLNADQSFLRICIDLQFENLMSEKELIHLARQLSRVYGLNKINPVHLTLASLSETSKTFQICCQKNQGFANYIWNRSQKPIDELIADPSKVVYLTPDADQVLEDFNKDFVYVIGGLVDDSVKKKSTLIYAQDHGYQVAKLPIDQFCHRQESGTFKQILTINQVFEIILNKANQGLDWSSALAKSLPSRIGFSSASK